MKPQNVNAALFYNFWPEKLYSFNLSFSMWISSTIKNWRIWACTFIRTFQFATAIGCGMLCEVDERSVCVYVPEVHKVEEST